MNTFYEMTFELRIQDLLSPDNCSWIDAHSSEIRVQGMGRPGAASRVEAFI